MSARQQIKKFILKFPGGESGLTALRNYRRRRYLQGIFSHYYQTNWWGDGESFSGPGSTLKSTENIRREIPHLIESLGIRSILDAPCGDYNWFRLIPREGGVRYTGGDIVPSLVAANNRRFGNDDTQFIVLDVTTHSLPDADLWLCRDCFIHLPNRDIGLALDRFRKSRIRYLLASTYPECRENIDISVGGCREQNLEIPPFNLCPPKLFIEDWTPGETIRRLALWERGMLE